MVQNEVFQIASRYLKKLRRSGNDNLTAVCPFHIKSDGTDERSPSFTMSLSKGAWQCWSCHARGNFQWFLRSIGLPRSVVVGQYQPLLEELQRHHAPAFDPLRPKFAEEEPLEEGVLGLFEKCPVDLVDEGFDESLLQRLDIGFDEASMRITFPLRDLWGNLVGISGRTVTGTVPRYKLFDNEYEKYELPTRAPPKKGSLLWNAHNVYPVVYFSQRPERIYLVEGFKACIWLMQAGIQNVVALAGSSMSDHQRWILERMGGPVYLMLDNDNAGRRAVIGYTDDHGRWRPGIAETLSKSLDVFIVEYETRQPTDLPVNSIPEVLETAEDFHLWITRNKEKPNVLW